MSTFKEGCVCVCVCVCVCFDTKCNSGVSGVLVTIPGDSFQII